jgi:hypothetical protein
MLLTPLVIAYILETIKEIPRGFKKTGVVDFPEITI